ncbi:NAD-dependent epimerase/dehydratase family protein [Halomarina ordinaria]|uniref:NAD-dependent epimerase/dehydratase family protein n=1 Tax=Halomarina ordinaria TaxID=3033939 RepID=A0ABD5UEJ0_9EURY|nr:NAD-dependent epimerase/dehydratase family protein [Halomarina sp. PSRA2]
MNILVTGGAGFIGGHLAEQLALRGHDVTALDNLDPFYDVGIKERTVERGRVAAEGEGSYSFVRGDIRDEDLVSDLVGDAAFVYHQAGLAGVRPSVDRPREYNEVNVGGTLNLLDAAREADVERVVMASSSSVYGKPQYLPYDEQHPTTPVSPYGTSKLAAERYGCAYAESYGLPFVGLRYFTVYGPRMRPNMAISNFVSRCMNGESPVIYGDGQQTRDFTFIDDIVGANLALLDTDAADGRAINVGSTDNISIQVLAEEVRDHIAPSLDIEYEAARTGDAAHTHADTGTAAALLEYEPEYTIREGLAAFIEWYRENREWYEPLVRGEESAGATTETTVTQQSR